MTISNGEIADRLTQTAHLLRAWEADRDRAHALEQAATSLRTAPQPITRALREDADLTRRYALSDEVAEAVRWIVETGTMPLDATVGEGTHRTEAKEPDATLGAPVQPEDLEGSLHMHSDFSDGEATVDEMVNGARRRGYRYMAITDHGEYLLRQGASGRQRLDEQARRIAALNAQSEDLRVLHGAEVDILEDGSLAFPEQALDVLDLCVASVHTAYERSASEQTTRIVRAIEHPRVHILGHPMGRHLGQRPPMQVDFDRIVEAAIANGVALEINGKPYRMDLPVRRIQHAAQAGVQFVLSADAHSVRDHDQLLNAVQQARRAGLSAGQILNTRSLPALTGWLTGQSAGVLTDS